MRKKLKKIIKYAVDNEYRPDQSDIDWCSFPMYKPQLVLLIVEKMLEKGQRPSTFYLDKVIFEHYFVKSVFGRAWKRHIQALVLVETDEERINYIYDHLKEQDKLSKL